jgi:hypothetical protein
MADDESAKPAQAMDESPKVDKSVAYATLISKIIEKGELTDNAKKVATSLEKDLKSGDLVTVALKYALDQQKNTMTQEMENKVAKFPEDFLLRTDPVSNGVTIGRLNDIDDMGRLLIILAKFLFQTCKPNSQDELEDETNTTESSKKYTDFDEDKFLATAKILIVNALKPDGKSDVLDVYLEQLEQIVSEQ